MIEVQQIADFLNTELNNIGKSQGYNFDIKAEVGERTNQDSIYGIVTTTKADARVDENVDYVFAVELSVPSAKTNENVINVEKIIGDFKNKFHMKNRAFGGGQGTLLISLATPKDYQIKYGVGDDVPLVFTITTEYIRNAVGSGDKHWLLNGMEIPFINESVSVQKEGRTNTIHGESYTKTLLTRQTRYYKFGFDYDNSELCIMLKKDLLDGKYDKVYTLTYYDGVSFTEEQPFTTSVSIFANGQSSSTKPNVSEFDITFTDVDNEEEAEYFMALIDNPFDSTTENTRYFSNEEEQRVYYQEKIDNDIRVGGVGCQFVKIKAPNLSSINITNQVYEIPLNDGEPIYDVLSVTNKNYAIIKVKKGDKEQWFYYYVSNQNIGGQNQVMFDLKLDSIQTYYFNPDLQFGECLIERGHENRWIDNHDGTVSFDGAVDSRLFEREDIQNVAKRLTKRTKVNMYNTGNIELDNWLNKAILGWAYMFLKPQTVITKYNSKTGGKEEVTPNSNFTLQYNSIESERALPNIPEKGIYSQFPVIAFPIYTSSKYVISISDSGNSTAIDMNTYNYTGINAFLKVNKGETLVYALKFSSIPPFNSDFKNGFEFSKTEDSYGNILRDALHIHGKYNTDIPNLGSAIYTNTDEINPLDFWAIQLSDGGSNGVGGIILTNQNPIHKTQPITINKNFTFNKTDVVNSFKNVEYNPKLLSSDYTSLILSDETENGFEYDVQKLNLKNLQPLLTEPIVADFAKKFIRFETDGVYSKSYEKSLIGFVSTNENSLGLSSTAYQSMLANNKNYFLQNSINRDFSLVQGLMSSGLALAGAGGNPLAVAGASIGAINTVAGTAKSIINEKLTVDNLKNAPSNVSQGRGNPFFNAMYSELGVIVEEWDILPNEKEIINDYMCKYGFTVNRFGNPKEYDNIRHYYNYVKAQIDSISGIAISNQARDDIRQRFANGVRFWKQDNIDYSMENYEEWLTTIGRKTLISFNPPISSTTEFSVAYEGVAELDKFYTYRNDTIEISTLSSWNIEITGVVTDGTYTINYTSGKAIIEFKNATYLNFDISVIKE